jgi:hypothetical protein
MEQECNYILFFKDFRSVLFGVSLMILGYTIIYLVTNLYVVFISVAIGGTGVGLCVFKNK